MKNFISTFFAFWKFNKKLAINLFVNYYLLKFWVFKDKKTQKSNSKKKIKKIIFLLGKGAKGRQEKTKGINPSNALRKKGIYCEVSLGKLPKNIENSMIVFIKYFPFTEVLKALKKNCVLVYEIVDNENPCLLENEKKLCDVIIFPNKRMQKDFGPNLPKKIKSFVMYHHWDSDFDKTENKKQNKEFSLAYFGSDQETNAIFSSKLNIPVFTKFPDHLKNKDKFNCLYSMRKEMTHEFLYKPSTKVATAAAVESNIITSKEPSAIELLGKDYPYLTDSDFNSVKKTIEYAKKTFGKKIWRDALKTMKKVKKKTDVNNIVKGYIEIINNLSIKNG